MDLSIAWWILVALGVVLITAEIFVGGFVILWFGIGAVVTGFLTLLMPDLHAGVQGVLSVALGTALLYMFRDRFIRSGASEEEMAMRTFSAGTGQLVLSDRGRPQVSCNGTHWVIANPDAIPEGATSGQTVTVERFENNQAFIQPL